MKLFYSSSFNSKNFNFNINKTIRISFIWIICCSGLIIGDSANDNEITNKKLKRFELLDLKDFQFESSSTTERFSNRNKREIFDTNRTSQTDNLVVDGNRLKFNAYGRSFNIYLKQNSEIISNNIDIEVRYSDPNRKSQIEHLNDLFTGNYYVGFVEDESDSSSVTCYFERPKTGNTNNDNQSLIYLQIRIDKKDENKTEYYYVEPFKSNKELKYVVYRLEDVQSDILNNGLFNQTTCHPKYVNDEAFPSWPLNNENSNLNKRFKRQSQSSSSSSSSSSGKSSKAKNRCNLALVADYRFYKAIGNSNSKQTAAYMINIIGQINEIFTKTTWNLDGSSKQDNENFGFTVEKVIVHGDPTVTKYPHYNNQNVSTSSDHVLELFGDEDWTKYCLAHLFTFQTLDNSVLGLAYVSSPLSYTLGGICSPPSYRNRRLFCVNIGLSSYKSLSLNQGRLLQLEAQLVTAHEFGHNWGSEHDPSKAECSPSSGAGGGNYIMYAYSNQGRERNNFFFSPCSVNSISEVLKTKAKCFRDESLSLCGNSRIDPGEECDAGIDTGDKCCNNECKLQPGAKCSDYNQNCCHKCQLAEKNHKCYSSSFHLECFQDHSYCDGLSFDCPVQNPKPANSACSSYDYGKCDSSGHCMSICQQKDSRFSSCLCSNPEEKCMICCRTQIKNSSSDVCSPYHVLFNGETKYLTNGRACFDGLCENRICRQIVKDYVSRFWKVIQTVTVSGFVEFMRRNIVGTIILFSLSLWVPFGCCIHFCIDKRQRTMNKQKLQKIKRENSKKRQTPSIGNSINSNVAEDEIRPLRRAGNNEPTELDTEL